MITPLDIENKTFSRNIKGEHFDNIVGYKIYCKKLKMIIEY